MLVDHNRQQLGYWYPLFLGMYPLFVAPQLAANDHAKLGSVNLLSFDSQWSEAGRDQQPSCFSPEIKGLFVEIYNFTQFYLFGAWTVGTPHLRKKRGIPLGSGQSFQASAKRCVLLPGPPQPCCQDTHWHFGCRFSMKIPGTMDKCLLALLFFGQNGRQLAAHVLLGGPNLHLSLQKLGFIVNHHDSKWSHTRSSSS
jgi:hypothetical protein